MVQLKMQVSMWSMTLVTRQVTIPRKVDCNTAFYSTEVQVILTGVIDGNKSYDPIEDTGEDREMYVVVRLVNTLHP